MENKFYWGALGESLISYLISCFLPCFSTSQESTIGYYCLLGGWTFIISDFWMFMIWSSNILYLCSLIMIVTNNSKCVCFSALSCILSISMIFHRYIIYDIIVPITHFQMGFYLGNYILFDPKLRTTSEVVLNFIYLCFLIYSMLD